jgi:hypothetical protein
MQGEYVYAKARAWIECQHVDKAEVGRLRPYMSYMGSCYIVRVSRMYQNSVSVSVGAINNLKTLDQFNYIQSVHYRCLVNLVFHSYRWHAVNLRSHWGK